MKLTKKLSCLMAATALLAATSALADPVNFDTLGVNNVGSLDWKAGNALAVGAVPTAVGKQFQLYYQSSLLGFLDATTGAAISTPLLNSTATGGYQITAVASFLEQVINVNPNGAGQSANFSLVKGGPSYVELYLNTDTTKFSNDLAGTNFAAGTLFLRGHAVDMYNSNFASDPTGRTGLLDQFGNDDWGGKQTVLGSGGTKVIFQVDWYDHSIIQQIYDFELRINKFDTSNNLPFEDVNPSRSFYNGFGGAPIIPSIGSMNGAIGPDILFQADAVSSLSAVPEPSTVILMGLGLAGLAGLRLRKNRK